MVDRTVEFIKSHDNCFDRSLLIGHVTGSAWIINPTRTHALLIHHKKLDKWFQPGGHCDGDPDVLHVALKEAEEETGLPMTVLSTDLFDVDIHWIPEKGDIPRHEHFDIRFLFEAKMTDEELGSNSEVKSIRWIKLEDVRHYNAETPIMRMVSKTI